MVIDNEMLLCRNLQMMASYHFFICQITLIEIHCSQIFYLNKY